MKTLMVIFLLSFVLAPVRASEPATDMPNSPFIISDKETEKFTNDPIAYISRNFNIKDHPAFLKSDSSKFKASFRCSKGYVTAIYDNKGDLLSTRLRFKNILIPTQIMSEIYRDYKGWEVTNIKYRASGRGETLTKARYAIRLERNGEALVIKKKLS